MLEAKSLTKCYASIPALRDVSFSIRPGDANPAFPARIFQPCR